MKIMSCWRKVQRKLNRLKEKFDSITRESQGLVLILVVLSISTGACTNKRNLAPTASDVKIACVSRTLGMPRPEAPPFTAYDAFIINTANAFLDWEVLLDKAEEDFRQCND